MSEVLDYRLVQFCPSPNDEVRVNIGVDVSDGDTHHLVMLNKTDLRRRCKMLTGKEPSTTNGVVNQLVEHSRWLTRMSKGYPLPAEFADRSFMPEIISTPGRFNNLVRLSEPNRVVYKDPRTTAKFLLEHLVPVADREPRPRIRTRITNRFISQVSSRPMLSAALIKKPDVKVKTQTVGVDFGFHRDEVRMLGRAFNFDREVDDSFENELYSMNHLFARIRSMGASTLDSDTGERQYRVPSNVGISVIYREPTGPGTRRFFNGIADEWNELGVRFAPESEMESIIEETQQLLLR